MEELHALGQAPLHDLGAREHLRHDGSDLGGTEVELLIEVLHRLEDLAVAEVWVIECRDLRAVLCEQVTLLVVQPAASDTRKVCG